MDIKGLGFDARSRYTILLRIELPNSNNENFFFSDLVLNNDLQLLFNYSVRYFKRVLIESSFSNVFCTQQRGTTNEHLNKNLRATVAQLTT